jgi:hypothetical protein
VRVRLPVLCRGPAFASIFDATADPKVLNMEETTVFNNEELEEDCFPDTAEDREWLAVVEIFFSREEEEKQKQKAAESAPLKQKKFEQLKDALIFNKLVADSAAKGVRLSFSNIGFWCLFYDECNIQEYWAKMSQLYLTGKLFGVLKLSKANGVDEKNPSTRGFPVLVFCGCANDEDYVKEVGRRVLESVAFTPQMCSKKFRRQKSYPRQIYYKLNGSKLYELPY